MQQRRRRLDPRISSATVTRVRIRGRRTESMPGVGTDRTFLEGGHLAEKAGCSGMSSDSLRVIVAFITPAVRSSKSRVELGAS